MPYEVNGTTVESDANGYLTDINAWNEEVGKAIAAAEGVEMTEKSWDVVNYLRDEYINNGGNQPNDRNIVKAMSEKWGEKLSSKDIYTLFPMQPSKQAAKIGGLPESRRKGGY
ncbi:TusE/DsrC/DsvC family sulfur relay protein [Thiohalomonas denitrificans]|uniref:Sulfurtransferase n=1 Tax=Thiohalomonas denitrificans TaxID=415747 RepID=A0A1G5QCV7_9GAMM|nr:TusE/DsrC/DsvC family sulfur relay protein [Thiohalomonas denitrificans]SCZ59725.1 tRNA 2-thiouridine synthesizing protein E [Thiohalomonas denitrificans]